MTAVGSRRRIVVTGLGAVTAIGQSVPELWASLRAGTCGIRQIERFYQNCPHFLTPSSINGYQLAASLGAQIESFDQRQRLQHIKRDKLIQLADRFSLFAATAAREAMEQAGLAHPLPNPYRTACIIGSAIAGVINVEAAYRHIFELKNPASHPMTLLRAVGSSPAAHVSIEYGIKGPVFGVCSTCTSGLNALSVASSYIRQGLVDIALAGAADAPHAYGAMRIWEAAGLLSTEGLFPFAQSRSGTVLGEGAGLLVLEELDHARTRRATPLAELCAIGIGASATDMSAPDPEGSAAAMISALRGAGLEPDDIDYVNAHGIGTKEHDLVETEAMRQVFGARLREVAVSGTKSMYGNVLGASGSIEAAICIKAISEGWVPPTAGGRPIDPRFDLDLVVGAGRSLPMRYAMSNAFGLMGLNASVIFGPPPE